MEETATFCGTPYFIKETGSGVFYVVKSATRTKKTEASTEGGLEFDEEIGELRSGMEIIETPNRNLKILVEFPLDAFSIPYIIQELRKYAQVSNYDFVSYEPFGEYISRAVAQQGNTLVSKVIPRIFRRAVNN